MPSSPSTSILSDANLSFVSSTPASSPGATFKDREHEKEDDSWVENFEIPSSFSDRSMDCLCTGILTQSCRIEKVQTVAAHMWVHTHHPSRFAYNTICSKLIKVHPKLADDAGDQVAYVSYSMYVCTLFIY